MLSKYIGPDNNPNDLKTIIIDLSERIRALETNRTLSASSITYIPVPFVDSSNYNPPSNTTSASFVTLQQATFVRRKNNIVIIIYFFCSDGTTNGEYVISDGVGTTIYGISQIITTTTVSLDFATNDFWAIGSQVELDIRVRRLGGSGTIGCRVYGAYEHD